MATVGKLSVILSLNSARFARGVTSATSRLRSMAAGVARVAKQVAKFGAALVLAAAVGISVLVKKTLASVDATAKMSRALGISTKALSSLEFAASIAGVSAGDLETAFRRMEKTVGDAKAGLSTAKRALDDLGLSSQELERLSPDRQFKLLAERLKGVEFQTDKARIAQDLFGRSGVKLIPLLDQGAEGISKLQAKAVELGIAFDEGAAAKIEKANDALTRLKGLVAGAVRTAVIELAPFIEAFGDSLTNSGLKADVFSGKVIDTVNVLRKLANVVERIAFGLRTISDVLSLGKVAVGGNFGDAMETMERIGSRIDTGRFISTFSEIDESTQRIKDNADAAAKALNEMNRAKNGQRSSSGVGGVGTGGVVAGGGIASGVQRVRLDDEIQNEMLAMFRSVQQGGLRGGAA